MNSKINDDLNPLKRLSEEEFKALRKEMENGPSFRERFEREEEKMKNKSAPEAEKKADFKCPICGGSEYKTYRSPIGPIRFGGPPTPTKIDCYSCTGCGVHFDDPVKFSQMRLVKARKKKRAAGKKELSEKKKLEEILKKAKEFSERARKELKPPPPSSRRYTK